MHWNRLPREVVGSSSLEMFQNHGEALRDVVCGHGEGGLGLDLGILEDFSNLNDSTVVIFQLGLKNQTQKQQNGSCLFLQEQGSAK